MTTVSRSMFPLSSGIKNITTMKEGYDKLQTQLATGLKASNLAEMGTDRYFDLALRQRMSRIDGYQGSVKTVNLRLEVLDTVMSRLDTIESDSRAAASAGGGGSTGANYQTTPTMASSRFDEVLTLMNTDIAGRYMFGGGLTEDKPVEEPYTVLNGIGSRAGFKQVAGERKLADLGTTHMGRTTVTTATDTVTLAEENAPPFGMKLGTISTTSSNISITSPTGSPQSLTVQFGATLPVAGEQVAISFTLPDGTEEQVVMVATAGTPVAGEFQIGTDANTTAANFGTALTASVKQLAEGRLVAASAFAAADDFFNGQGETSMRVDGPPFDTATGQIAATAANTVLWYKGEDSSDPRHTITAKVGDGTTVG